jgi:hypothetical protein
MTSPSMPPRSQTPTLRAETVSSATTLVADLYFFQNDARRFARISDHCADAALRLGQEIRTARDYRVVMALARIADDLAKQAEAVS